MINKDKIVFLKIIQVSNNYLFYNFIIKDSRIEDYKKSINELMMSKTSKNTSTGSQPEKFDWNDALVHHMLITLHERIRQEERYQNVKMTAFIEYAKNLY